MEMIKSLQLIESQQLAEKQLKHVSFLINKTYNEWKKLKRRRNSIDIVATATNALRTIPPDYIKLLSEENKAKLCIVLIRCMDLPVWANVRNKERTWKKLYEYIVELQNFIVPTKTNSALKDVIATRLSARIGYKLDKKIFVTYERHVSEQYLEFLFGKDQPTQVYRMMIMSLPEDFGELCEILRNNFDRVLQKINPSQAKDSL
jgi:hypothetical protein